VARSEAGQGLERGHGKPPAIVTKDEFIEVYLKLIAAHTVAGSNQPLLEVANRAVGQRHDGLCAFAQVDAEGLVPRHMFEPGFL
jgi:hypothetical protein